MSQLHCVTSGNTKADRTKAKQNTFRTRRYLKARLLGDAYLNPAHGRQE